MQVAQTLSSWLLRSYIDLKPTPCKGILHPHGVDHAFRVLTHGDTPPPLLLPPPPRAFRTALLRKMGRPRCDVDDPCQLPRADRSSRWHLLCDYLAARDMLSAQDILATLQVVSKLCLDLGVLRHAPEPSVATLARDETWAQVAWLRAHAAYRSQVETGETPSDAHLRVLAELAPRGGLAQVSALHQLCLHALRHAPTALSAWLSQYETAMVGVEDCVLPMHAAALRSRLHRMAAQVAQQDGRPAAVHAALNRAEACVQACSPRTAHDALAQAEALVPILEARCERARALHDLPLAERCARQLSELCPLDGRARLLYGEVLLARGNVLGAMSEYRWATRLAPPDEEIAWFMLGQCHEVLGHRDAAFDAYLHALAVDPGALSATRRLRALVKGLVPSGVAVWAHAQDALLRRAARWSTDAGRASPPEEGRQASL